MFKFYNHWKHQETFSFLVFPEDMEREHWSEMGEKWSKICWDTSNSSQVSNCDGVALEIWITNSSGQIWWTNQQPLSVLFASRF